VPPNPPPTSSGDTFSTINTGVILFLPFFPTPTFCFNLTGLFVPFDVANLIPLDIEPDLIAPADKPMEASADVIVG